MPLVLDPHKPKRENFISHRTLFVPHGKLHPIFINIAWFWIIGSIFGKLNSYFEFVDLALEIIQVVIFGLVFLIRCTLVLLVCVFFHIEIKNLR